ncbi:unnamed protein product [Mucor hiemalis]
MARNTMYLPLFINGTSRNALNNFITPKANFEAQLVFSNTVSHDKTAIITSPNNSSSILSNCDLSSSNLSSVYGQFQNGRYSKVLGVIGPFAELNKDLEEALNSNFSHKKHLVPLIPDLFVGGLIQAKSFVLMITSCELYARDANIDEHLESNRGTFPYIFEAESRRYNGVIIKVTQQSDGGAIINNPQFGTTQFNLLVTGSLVLFPHISNTTSIWPSCNSFLVNEKLNECALLFPEKNTQKFMTQFADASHISSKTPKIEDVRQLTTLLQHPSKHFNYLSHLLEDRLLYPATKFILSK